ncbi:hypothetical protein E1297_09445 [Roseibium sp. RKSG952]|nr:hypothetical protein [Roseibium sp. RKSG952]MTH96207.1 hypothetical protein [Roseibium sp. RKSG952]
MRQVICVCLAWAAGFAALPAHAAKGDRQVDLPRVSPLLEGRVLELRFPETAEGIWVRRDFECADITRIHDAPPGSVVAIYRGLFETPGQICQVYGAEQGAANAQRAAMNCMRDDGGSALGLVTLRPRGSSVLLVQDGDLPPVAYRFCRPIRPVLIPQD